MIYDRLYIFLIMLHFSAGCDLVQNKQLLEVTGSSGESVVLPCSCTEPQAKPDQMKWIYYHQGNYEEIYPSEHIEKYKNRVTLLNQNTGNLSLLISSLTKEDNGDYQCTVSPNKYIFIRLHVKGCDLVKQTLEVTGSSGESVVLPCSCTEPQAKPNQLKWKYHHQGKYEEIYPSERIERYKNRVTLLNQNTPGNLSLLLSSLTEEDKGDYLCTVSPNIHIFIRLHVKESPASQPLTTSKQTNELTQKPNDPSSTDQENHVPPYDVILMAVLTPVLLLAFLAFIYWRWKGGKNVKVTRDGPELVREPKNEDSTNLKDEVTYSAVVHVKTSSKPASTQNEKVDDTEYACVNLKPT